MKPITRLLRLIRIYYVLIKYQLDEFLLKNSWFYPLHFFRYFNPWYWYFKNRLSRGGRIRCAIEDLGPIFIKAGQIISR